MKQLARLLLGACLVTAGVFFGTFITFARGAAASAVGMTEPSTNAQADQTIQDLGLREEYPFRHHFLATPHGRMHYVDEGEGEPVLALHGNPTWSFLYRHLIGNLSADHRVIAPDLIGFGLSEKPSDVSAYSIEGHAADIDTLITKLDLHDVTLVVHDWGGPIGLAAFTRHPDRLRRLVVLNTAGFFYIDIDGDKPRSIVPPLALRVIRAPGVGETLIRGLGFFHRVILPQGILRADRYTDLVRRAYRAPHDSYGTRAGVLAFPRLIPTSTEEPVARLLINEVDPFLRRFRGPVLIVWAMKDFAFTPTVLEGWRQRFPMARVVELPEAGHYLQEDAYETIVPAVRDFLSADTLAASR